MNLGFLFRRKSIDSIIRDAENLHTSKHQLKRNLTVVDLTALGIAAIVGAGIFSTIGKAALTGGPAVFLLFVFTGIACGLSAMCYAEFASRIPISGSAYTYAYASFGELIAWIIGWDLIMEYAVGNIAVAISWSDYFTGLMHGLHVSIPEYLTTDFLSASRGYQEAIREMASGTVFTDLSASLQEAYQAWSSAPQLFGVHLIADIPAFLIVVLITVLVYVGIYETKVASNTMVILKLSILMLVIGVGSFYIKPENWSPFAPHGVGGVLKGVAGVFFAYIGFDAISTTAEECRNPRRDLPRSMIYSLVITTILYILIALVLTGMVHYDELGIGDPLAFAFSRLDLNYLSGIIAVSAIIAMASVLLVFQVGQPRIWMSMSRDGLLPRIFSKIHPKFKTPSFSTIITGILVAIPSLFMNLTEVTDLTSIGTLFAFILVSGGILVQDSTQPTRQTPKGIFRVPYINSRFYLPMVWGIVIAGIYWLLPEEFQAIRMQVLKEPVQHIPFLIFLVLALVITILGIWKKFSLIPVLGLLTNGYLIAQLGITNWMRFLIWLVVGLALYFVYGWKHSRLGISPRQSQS